MSDDRNPRYIPCAACGYSFYPPGTHNDAESTIRVIGIVLARSSASMGPHKCHINFCGLNRLEYVNGEFKNDPVRNLAELEKVRAAFPDYVIRKDLDSCDCYVMRPAEMANAFDGYNYA